MTDVIWVLLLGVGAFLVASSLTEPNQPLPRKPPVSPPHPKPGGGIGGGFGLSPSTTTHALSEIDEFIGPHRFSEYAGYPIFDDFIADNPELLVVQPESVYDWPSYTSFNYWISGSEVVATFTPTHRLEPFYRIPTYTRADRDGEFMFPFWNTKLVHAEGSVIKGPEPLNITTSSLPIVENINGRTYAVVPWVVGTIVTVRNEPFYL